MGLAGGVALGGVGIDTSAGETGESGGLVRVFFLCCFAKSMAAVDLSKCKQNWHHKLDRQHHAVYLVPSTWYIYALCC